MQTPKTVFIRGVRCDFQCFAPITGDALYHGMDKDERLINALIPNPDAAAFQLRYFQNNPVG